MSFGQHCACNSCDFVFYSGHSHHAGYNEMLCLACLTEFALPTESLWGPQVGELIMVHRLVWERKVVHKKKPPRFTARLEPTDEFLIAESAGEWGIHYPIDHLICPHCQRVGSMALDFAHGQGCPKCDGGIVECGQLTY